MNIFHWYTKFLGKEEPTVINEVTEHAVTYTGDKPPTPTQIKGYRTLSKGELDLINEIKAKANEVGELVAKLRTYSDTDVTQRWVSIAQTELQEGFMALVRSVAKPEGFA